MITENVKKVKIDFLAFTDDKINFLAMINGNSEGLMRFYIGVSISTWMYDLKTTRPITLSRVHVTL